MWHEDADPRSRRLSHEVRPSRCREAAALARSVLVRQLAAHPVQKLVVVRRLAEVKSVQSMQL